MSLASFTHRNVTDRVYCMLYTSHQKRVMPPLIIHCEGKVKMFAIEGVRDSFEYSIYLKLFLVSLYQKSVEDVLT